MDDNYVIGIHRTGFTPINEKMINEIFSNGLLNLGKSRQGSSKSISFEIDNIVSVLNKFQYLISQIKSAAGYNESNGSIILKIPKSSLGLNGDVPIPIYQIINNKSYIRPEFIYGYIPVDYKGNTGCIVRNPNYRDIHKIESDYIYEYTVIKNAKEILFRNYELTYNKCGKNQADTALIKFIINNDVSYFTGENNRKLLNSRIDIYNCIKKIDYPKGITNSDLQNIIDTYENRLSNENTMIKK